LRSLFKHQSFENSSEVSARAVNPNLTINAAESYILNHVPPSYQRMIASNFSFGIERDPEMIAKNDNDHRKWANPLEVRLPNAPSMKIHCRKPSSLCFVLFLQVKHY
jgi:phospholipid:diacylglycerol acyltransferase